MEKESVKQKRKFAIKDSCLEFSAIGHLQPQIYVRILCCVTIWHSWCVCCTLMYPKSLLFAIVVYVIFFLPFTGIIRPLNPQLFNKLAKIG